MVKVSNFVNRNRHWPVVSDNQHLPQRRHVPRSVVRANFQQTIRSAIQKPYVH
jgi:hypothetical protein